MLKAGKDECLYKPCISTKLDYLMILLAYISNVRTYRHWADLLDCFNSYCVLLGKLLWFSVTCKAIYRISGKGCSIDHDWSWYKDVLMPVLFPHMLPIPFTSQPVAYHQLCTATYPGMCLEWLTSKCYQQNDRWLYRCNWALFFLSVI